ncbi:MAG: hypothetical protein ACP5NW_00165 [Candidatus Woesearchaeota archaeon]
MGDKKNSVLMIMLLIVFAAIFFISFAGLKSEEALFDIGIPPLYENWLIMFLSLGSIVRIVWELYKM